MNQLNTTPFTVFLRILICGIVLAGSVHAAEKKPKAPLEGLPAHADPAQEGVDPALPNVLIIGDSISIDYTPFVAELLKGKANVFHCGGRWNQNATSTGLALSPKIKKNKEAPLYLDYWINFQDIKVHPLVVHDGYSKMPIHHPTIDYSAYGLKWDVITCNWGMWDIARGHHKGLSPEELAKKVPKDPATSLEVYTQRLGKSFDMLKESGAAIYWVATTPVHETIPNVALRQEADVIAYNAAAAKLAAEKDVKVIDVHAAIKPRITDASWRRKSRENDVHFSAKGSQFLAEQLVEAFAKDLQGKDGE